MYLYIKNMATVISHKIKQIIKSNILEKNEKDLPRLNVMEQLYTIDLKKEQFYFLVFLFCFFFFVYVDWQSFGRFVFFVFLSNFFFLCVFFLNFLFSFYVLKVLYIL